MLPCLSPPSPPTPLKLWLFLKRSPRREPSRVENKRPFHRFKFADTWRAFSWPGGRGRLASSNSLRHYPPGTGKASLLPARETHRQMPVGSGVRFPRWKEREAKQTLSCLARSLGYNVRRPGTGELKKSRAASG